jgi:hypothetical protein
MSEEVEFPPIEFPPYVVFRMSLAQINEFALLTGLSYGLAQQLLFRFPRGELSQEIPKNFFTEKRSFSMADIQATHGVLVCGWLPIEEYATRVGADAVDLVERARQGELGPTERHPNTGEMLVMWPPEYQSCPREELPAAGMNTYNIRVIDRPTRKISVDLEDTSSFEATQAAFLHLAHALGAPAQVAERAKEVLNRSTLLLYWTAFEVFLRSTVHEMIRRHPALLASGKRGRETLTYREIATLSGDFTSMEQLFEGLVARELDRTESSGESVHGLINYLKSRFRFKTDPYDAWYIFEGHEYKTSFQELMQLKQTRNALIHDAGRISDPFKREYPDVPTRDGLIAVSDSFLIRGILLLSSLAFKIAETIEEKEYRAT